MICIVAALPASHLSCPLGGSIIYTSSAMAICDSTATKLVDRGVKSSWGRAIHSALNHQFSAGRCANVNLIGNREICKLIPYSVSAADVVRSFLFRLQRLHCCSSRMIFPLRTRDNKTIASSGGLVKDLVPDLGRLTCQYGPQFKASEERGKTLRGQALALLPRETSSQHAVPFSSSSAPI